ncbi:hypothetical protein SAY87_031870 [Trapa incisa]|uniref:Uncharacterized protein n=1 Tax=Trapa incisa TaxID=236973 RepID=A0AAN7KVV1_9MYRT|nr:hypothetical protein SAY87_031870 [Trapa incisa]
MIRFIREGAFENDHQIPKSDSSMEVSDAAPCNSKRRRLDQPESRYHDQASFIFRCCSKLEDGVSINCRIGPRRIGGGGGGGGRRINGGPKWALHYARVSTRLRGGRSANHNL